MKHFLQILFCCIFFQSCINPFSPKIIDSEIDAPIISDQKTIDGVFQNFRYSYVFEDTLVYSNLLDDNFTFVYKNYELGVDVSWGKEQDVRATFGLFQAASNIDLIWNETYTSIGDSLEKNVQRGFSLTIVFSPTDVVRLQGKANFRLIFYPSDSIWKITYWRDETYF
jgi:hypothetical protein